MNRKRLARLAYNTAIDRVARDPSLTTSQKRDRYFRISNAYEARKSQLEFAEFARFHRLDLVLGSKAIERETASITTPVEGGRRAA